MKAVILAGGKGTRISEESVLRPKPMIEIGGKPILWHIMKRYEKYGITEFVICCGYKGNLIKKYFVDYIRCQSDMVTDLSDKGISRTLLAKEKWKITLVDTGLETLMSGRIVFFLPTEMVSLISICMTCWNFISSKVRLQQSL